MAPRSRLHRFPCPNRPKGVALNNRRWEASRFQRNPIGVARHRKERRSSSSLLRSRPIVSWFASAVGGSVPSCCPCQPMTSRPPWVPLPRAIALARSEAVPSPSAELGEDGFDEWGHCGLSLVDFLRVRDREAAPQQRQGLIGQA